MTRSQRLLAFGLLGGDLRTRIPICEIDWSSWGEVYGFAKNERANISDKELKALKLLAIQLLGYILPALTRAIKVGELIEVTKDG